MGLNNSKPIQPNGVPSRLTQRSPPKDFVKDITTICTERPPAPRKQWCGFKDHILSLDGGGVRLFSTIPYLKTMEERLERNVSSFFL